MPVVYFASSAAREEKIEWMVSSEELLKTGGAFAVTSPIVPPPATVSNAHTFQTMMPTNAMIESVSNMSQSRTGSKAAPERKRLKKEPMELKLGMDGG